MIINPQMTYTYSDGTMVQMEENRFRLLKEISEKSNWLNEYNLDTATNLNQQTMEEIYSRYKTEQDARDKKRLNEMQREIHKMYREISKIHFFDLRKSLEEAGYSDDEIWQISIKVLDIKETVRKMDSAKYSKENASNFTYK